MERTRTNQKTPERESRNSPGEISGFVPGWFKRDIEKAAARMVELSIRPRDHVGGANEMMQDKSEPNPFAAFGCPGIALCAKLPRQHGCDAQSAACKECPAPSYVWVGGTKVYRSYNDYVG